MPAICKYQETIKEIEMTEGNTDTINDRNSLTPDKDSNVPSKITREERNRDT